MKKTIILLLLSLGLNAQTIPFKQIQKSTGTGSTVVTNTAGILTYTDILQSSMIPTLSTYIPYTGAPQSFTMGNYNGYANNFASRATNVVSAGSTTSMTVLSTRLQQLTGTNTHTFNLPDATTLFIGFTFEFNNNSSLVLTVNDKGGNLIASVPSGGYCRVLTIAVSTPNGAWDKHFLMPSNASFGTNQLNITGGLSSNGTYNYNRNYLRDLDAKISNIQQTTSNSTLSIAWIGDSWIAGTTVCPPIASYLRFKFGDAGCGYYGVGAGNNGNTFGSNGQSVTRTKFGSWANKVGTTYVKAAAISIDSTSTVGDSIYWVGNATDFVVHYQKKASGGNFVIRVDGTNPTTVTTAGTSTIAFSSKTGLTDGTHTLSVKVSTAGSGVLICGVEVNRNTNGVRVHNLGCSGTSSTNWINQDSLSWQTAIQQLNPNLAIITLGVNDCVQGITVPTYIGNITRIVNRVKAAMPNCDVMLFSQGDISGVTTYSISLYMEALKNYALANNYAYIDNVSLLGNYTQANNRGLYTDALHLNLAGGNVLKLNFLDYLMDGLPMYYDYNTNLNYGKNSLLSSVATGTYNTVFGVNSMSVNTTGSQNNAFGYNTLFKNTTGSNNCAFGNSALSANTTGSNNVAFGFGAMITNTTGSQNVGLGSQALNSLTSGGSNVAVGYFAMRLSTAASGNSAFGSSALQVNTGSTFNNTAIGAGALAANTNGNNNTAVGYYANGTATTGSGNVMLGNFAGYYETAGSSLYIDNTTRTNLATQKIQSLIYGTFNASVASQQLTINGQLNLGNAQTSVGGSTSGTANYSQPFSGTAYKKVIVYCAALLGTASYTFPVAFTQTPAIVTTNGPAAGVVTALTTTSITITGATTTGFVIIEGY